MDEQVARETPTTAESPVRRTAIQRDRMGKGGLGGKILFLLILAIAAAAAYWAFYLRVAPVRQAQGAPAQAIRDAVIGKKDISIALGALGTVTPLATVTIRTQIAGQLQQIAFTEGQMVHKGDFLAQIDPRPYQVVLQQAQGQLAKDQALLDQSKADLARYQTLAKQDSIAHQQADNQVFLVQQYQGAVTIDNAQIDSAKLNIAYCRIVSPIDGRAGLRQVDVGNYAQASDANGIVIITQIEPISITFTIPEDNLPDVMRRMKSGAKLPVTAFDRANTKQLATGTLLTTDNQIDTTTGTVKLRAAFDNKDDSLFPQQFVNVILLVDTLKDQVAAPVAAIQSGSIGSFVYVVGADNTVTARPVTTGPRDGDFISITKGLDVGEHVVIDGIDRLRDGAKVMVRNNDQQAPVGAGAPDAARPQRRQQPAPQ